MVRYEYRPGITDKCNDYSFMRCAWVALCAGNRLDEAILLMSANQRDHTPIDSVATSGHMTDFATIGCY